MTASHQEPMKNQEGISPERALAFLIAQDEQNPWLPVAVQPRAKILAYVLREYGFAATVCTATTGHDSPVDGFWGVHFPQTKHTLSAVNGTPAMTEAMMALSIQRGPTNKDSLGPIRWVPRPITAKSHSDAYDVSNHTDQHAMHHGVALLQTWQLDASTPPSPPRSSAPRL